MNLEVFKSAGLTDGEIKVYMALTELGSSTTGPIIENCGIARSIIYQILEKLIQKGLVSYIIKDKTKYYQTTAPSKLLDYVDERKQKLENNRKQIENILPQLLIAQNKSKSKEAQIYEGFKGVQTVFENTYSKLKSGEEYLCLGIPTSQEEKHHTYWKRDHIRRAKAGIKCKLLFNQGTGAEILKNRNSYKLCEARYMPIDVQTPSWFLIYKDVVTIGLLSQNGFAVEITNQEIADSFKAYFMDFWKKSKPFKA